MTSLTERKTTPPYCRYIYYEQRAVTLLQQYTSNMAAVNVVEKMTSVSPVCKFCCLIALHCCFNIISVTTACAVNIDAAVLSIVSSVIIPVYYETKN